jgi:DNA-directed RNA polymerase sigma subunit (sigma70/sigma32)
MDRFIQSFLAAAPLSAEDEARLATRSRAGDVQARAELITAGMRLVAMQALMRGLRGEALRDGVQSGAVALIRAVDSFDPARGVRLATYTWKWIAGALVQQTRPEVPLDDVEQTLVVEDGYDVSELDGYVGLEFDVLRMRFGIGDFSGFAMSRRQIAERLNLTSAKVRALEGEAVRQVHRGLARVYDRADE